MSPPDWTTAVPTLCRSACMTGEGIPPDVQPRIFEPFFSLQTDNHSKEGLGLGLSIVKSVDRNGGWRNRF